MLFRSVIAVVVAVVILVLMGRIVQVAVFGIADHSLFDDVVTRQVCGADGIVLGWHKRVTIVIDREWTVVWVVIIT